MSLPDPSRTMSWTARFKQMLRGQAKKNNRHHNAYIRKIGPWGGVNGHYKDTEVAPLCLKNITIESGEYIHFLKFSYNDEYGMKHHAGPWGGTDRTHFSPPVLNKIQIGPEEYLTGISGTSDFSNIYGTSIITSLTFITNKGQYGPFGRAGKIPFRSPQMSSSSSIVGFFCRCGTVVDAIGLYVKLEREPFEKQDLITKVGPWGSDFGQYHDANVVPERLISVVVCSGKVIDSLVFIYSDRDGEQHIAGPWGGLGTSKKGAFHSIMLGHSEIVKEVSGTIDFDIVTSLLFVTNISTYGPFGDGGGMPFCSTAQDNANIVGFFARAEQHINAIGFYMAPIKKQDNSGNGKPSTSTRIQGAVDEKNKNAYIKKIGPWGGPEGTYRDIKILPVCLNSITIKSGGCVYSLEFSYSDEYGVPHHAGPWGGDVKYLTAGVVNTIQFEPTEFLTGISGTILGPSNHYAYPILQSLMFITNARQYGPFGAQTGDHFRSPLSSNSSIVGFFARSGDIVDAIGLYVKFEREPIEKQDSITKVGPWGGDWGQDHDVDVAPRRLISMVVCSGEVIHSLTFIYIDHDGHQHTAGPWGGLGMSKKGAFHTIMLGRSEIVKEVYGTIGPSTIASLSFVTNIATYGPFGDGNGMQFRSPVHDNDSIVGFFAKAEKHINAIGFYLASIDKQDDDGDPSTNQKLEDDMKTLDKEFITKIGPWGGCKGNHKDIEVAPLSLNSVTICSGEVLFSLAFSYNDADGKQHHAGPWGASEGFSYGSFYTIHLGPSEFLVEVSGTIGSSSKYSSNVLSEVSGTTDFSSDHSSDVVTSIMFITNVHRHGPFGGGGGIPFHSPVLSCGSIIGFFAHADRVVDAIGLYVNPESKPTKEQDSVIKIGPWGGDLGRPNDVDVLPRRLISVVVHSGKVINTLTFTYSDCNGQEHTAGPWGRTGEPTDGSSHEILLGPSDFLMEVSGTIGQSSEDPEDILLGQYDFLMEVTGTIGRRLKHLDVVKSLLFVTNTGSYGPYGEGGGTHFRSLPQTDGSIVGFFVNVEDVIHAIGVYFRDASRHRVDIQSASGVLEHIILDGSVEPTNVPLALLQHITEDFNEKREIGRGGFGVVYKGDLQNGSVAVKRLSNSYTIDEALFNREANSMVSVKHENIVRLLGYCANTEYQAIKNPEPQEKMKFIFAEIRERILCFEYIKKGSLDKYLTNELTGLDWHERYKIIKGICNGLDYLHNEKGIIHKDLKPANILVDDLMVPKITDFGTSKFLGGATHTVTSNPAMSRGYTAPEFIDHQVVSCKLDIYSLGVIIMELVTGRRGDSDKQDVLRRWRHRWNKSMKYPPLGYQQVTKCIDIALTCLSDSRNERPYIKEILSMLDAIEKTDVQINNAGEPPVGPISPYPWELFEFDKLELNFPFEINKQIPCSLELINVTDDYAAFNIQRSGMLEYRIEPSKGVVPPRSKCTVIVTLQPRKTVPYDTISLCKYEFIVVRCATVNEGLTAEDIHEDMFNMKSGKLVDEVTLTVVI